MQNQEISTTHHGLTEQVARGIDALRSGQRMAAQKLFAQAVLKDQDNAMAWLWLSRSVDDERQRQECISHVCRLERQGTPLAAPTQIEGLSAPQDRDEVTASSQRDVSRPGAKGLPFIRRYRWGLVATLVVAIAICVIVLPSIGRTAAAQGGTDGTINDTSLEASGVIQGEEILLSSEYGGQVGDILVEEGQAVSAGQVIVQLDTGLLDTQVAAAQAAVEVAKRGADQARAGARAGQSVCSEAIRWMC